jgi:CubicO group peptidase (beta-lactamase class C family)
VTSAAVSIRNSAQNLRATAARASACAVLVLATGTAPAALADDAYFPGPGNAWERRDPAAGGMRPQAIADAIAFAQANEVNWSRDVRAQIEKDVAKEPYPAVIGETRERGGPAGVILRQGYIVAEWGDVHRPDMSFSVAKSYLSTLAGIAIDRGLIASEDDRVAQYVQDGGFSDPHNAPVTWKMLLNMTSEWQGTLWDKPDVADRRRGYDRSLQPAGTFWEYNDVRVNRLALSLLRVWGKPLSQVLKDEVMDPIGASGNWIWHGYRNSWVELNGQRVQSVSGGSHWGGGLWASARDHARFGYLMLRHGRWRDRTIVSPDWLRRATSPTALAPHYGYLWWLNPGGKILPAAPQSSFFALGSGGNMIWVDREHDLVVVTRWLEPAQWAGFAERVMAAVQ